MDTPVLKIDPKKKATWMQDLPQRLAAHLLGISLHPAVQKSAATIRIISAAAFWLQP